MDQANGKAVKLLNSQPVNQRGGRFNETQTQDNPYNLFDWWTV